MIIPIGVVTISDRAARGIYEDKGGPGIEAADLPHIFTAYWSGQRQSSKGTGLGLFIAKAIVEAHGGRLEVESQPGDGASFTVAFPLATARGQGGA